MKNFLDKHQQKLFQLCRKYEVEKLYAFGSVLTPNFNQNSDVDLIVKFDTEGKLPEEIGDYFWDFSWDLEQLFERKVDLMLEKPIKNPIFRQRVEADKVLVYGR